MKKTSVWEVYQALQDMKLPAVSISAVAERLAIKPDVAAECAIILDKLDLARFDPDRLEISQPSLVTGKQ